MKGDWTVPELNGSQIERLASIHAKRTLTVSLRVKIIRTYVLGVECMSMEVRGSGWSLQLLMGVGIHFYARTWNIP